MKKLRVSALIGVYAIALVASGAQLDRPLPGWTTFKSQYRIHAGQATRAEHSTSTGSAITVAFEGKAAKSVFDQMGPDAKNRCSAEKGDRERRNKGALCTFTAKLDRATDTHYRCWIGVDLRTGEGHQGISC